jgi:hypothetical protein
MLLPGAQILLVLRRNAAAAKRECEFRVLRITRAWGDLPSRVDPGWASGRFPKPSFYYTFS